MNFDLKTAFLLFITTQLLLTIVISIIWVQNKNKFMGIEFWVASVFIQWFALSLMMLRGIIPSILSIVIANLMIYSSVAFLMLGISKFLEININRKPYYAFGIILIGFFYYFSEININIDARIIFSSAYQIIIYTVCIKLILKDNQDSDKFKNKTAIISFLLMAILHSSRIIYTLSTPSPYLNYFDNNFDSIFLTILHMLVLLLVFSLIIMINNKLVDNIQENSHEKEIMLQELKLLVNIDSMTQIFNRKRIEEILINEIKRANRYDTPLSILLLDIDKFKNINDTYGHNIGDEILKSFADLVKSSIRETDYYGRWGGEEFLIILPSTDINDSYTIAEKIRIIVEKQAINALQKITISIGVTQLDQDNTYTDMIRKADFSMYNAKANGRNRVEKYVEDEIKIS